MSARPYGSYGYPERRQEIPDTLEYLRRIEEHLAELVQIARGQDQLLNYARQQEDMVQAIRDAALEIEREKQEKVD